MCIFIYYYLKFLRKYLNPENIVILRKYIKDRHLPIFWEGTEGLAKMQIFLNPGLEFSLSRNR